MGKELADAFPESREVFDQADEALGVKLSETCFGGTEDELAMTETTQPAILTVSIAALRALAARGVSCEATAGHSLGEYSAHVTARTFDFADAVGAVRARGRFMQEAVPVGEGAMAAILGLETEQVEKICRECANDQVLSPANLNAREQIVIAGHTEAVHRAVDAASAQGAKRAIPLAVSAPFHCALMKPAAERLAPVLEEMPFSDPEIPVFVNVDAAPVRSDGAARDALIRQVASPVRWHELAVAMVGAGIDTIVELGPGRVLSSLARRMDRSLRTFAVSDPDGVAKVVDALGGQS